MKMFKDKPCKLCSTVFTPTAPADIYCSSCKEIRKEENLLKNRKESYNRWANKQISLGRESVVGVGRGGSNKKGKEHKQYKNGIGFFHRVLKKEVKKRRYCENCHKDLKDATVHEWCAHHIDHDRSNNIIANIKLLCKRCHQLEHKCWESFNKV